MNSPAILCGTHYKLNKTLRCCGYGNDIIPNDHTIFVEYYIQYVKMYAITYGETHHCVHQDDLCKSIGEMVKAEHNLIPDKWYIFQRNLPEWPIGYKRFKNYYNKYYFQAIGKMYFAAGTKVRFIYQNKGYLAFKTNNDIWFWLEQRSIYNDLLSECNETYNPHTIFKLDITKQRCTKDILSGCKIVKIKPKNNDT